MRKGFSMIFFSQKHIFGPSLEPSHRDSCNEGSQLSVLLRNKEHHHRIIFKSVLYLELSEMIHMVAITRSLDSQLRTGLLCLTANCACRSGFKLDMINMIKWGSIALCLQLLFSHCLYMAELC